MERCICTNSDGFIDIHEEEDALGMEGGTEALWLRLPFRGLGFCFLLLLLVIPGKGTRSPWKLFFLRAYFKSGLFHD